MNKKLEELKKIEAEYTDANKELKAKVSKANSDMSPEDMKEICASLAKYIDYVDQRVNRAFQAIYECDEHQYEYASKHRVGHFPPLSMSQMKKVMDKCGIADDFNLIHSQTVITASKNSQNIEISLKDVKI